MNREELVAAARTAAQNAYSPYSHFRVGAVVVSSDGETFTGANIENAAYPSSNCAEATAIHTAVAAGVRKIDTLAVACIDAPVVQGSYPCGRCRQIMSEFGVETVIVAAGHGSEMRVHTRCRQIMSEFGVETVIVAAGHGSEMRVHTLDELLPFRFTL